eukprot:TRINITY_DN10746_c0_g1_i1.p3 TRINITY_DN10746_c0_g1~~TRINITY_DN10746_c0_g1_i1.p3  ORF type:complete len:116 (+),score=14.27 TRINITY_DN10746_c0_g1_i1:147-494(+)
MLHESVNVRLSCSAGRTMVCGSGLDAAPLGAERLSAFVAFYASREECLAWRQKGECGIQLGRSAVLMIWSLPHILVSVVVAVTVRSLGHEQELVAEGLEGPQAVAAHEGTYQLEI